MNSLFTIRTANEWLETAAGTPARKPLYGSLWHEGETVCLMDKARTCKTALALKIADEVAASRRVLFIDFAATARRFAAQASGPFSPRLHRLEVCRDALEELGPDGLFAELEKAVGESGIKVCIVDSLSWLCDYFRKPDAARMFMRKFAALRRSLGLSLLIVSNPLRCVEPFFDNIFPAASPEAAVPAVETAPSADADSVAAAAPAVPDLPWGLPGEPASEALPGIVPDLLPFGELPDVPPFAPAPAPSPRPTTVRRKRRRR